MDDHKSGVLADYYTERQLAEQLDVTPRTLWRWRNLRTGPDVTMIGARVMYHKGAVRRWLASCEQKMVRERRRSRRANAAVVP